MPLVSPTAELVYRPAEAVPSLVSGARNGMAQPLCHLSRHRGPGCT